MKLSNAVKINLSVVVMLAISACTHTNQSGVIGVGGDKILTFDEAMKDLGQGLKALTDNKDKNYGLVADEVTVMFSLKKTKNSTLGVVFNASGEAGGVNKVESFSIQRAEGNNTSQNKQIEQLVDKLLSSTTGKGSSSSSSTNADQGSSNQSSEGTSNDSSEQGSTSNSEASSSSEQKDFDERKNNIVNELTTKLTAGANINYSLTQTGDGQNLIQIKFKSLASYPVEKIDALARFAQLGCLPFLVQVMGDGFADKPADTKYSIAELAKVMVDAGLPCDSNVTEKGNGPQTEFPE